jgi:3-oxoacyl-[acyl-carrier protein] reductase
VQALVQVDHAAGHFHRPAELVGRQAFGRSAEPWEVANVMVFLASDYASYLTGEVVSVSSQHA